MLAYLPAGCAFALLMAMILMDVFRSDASASKEVKGDPQNEPNRREPTKIGKAIASLVLYGLFIYGDAEVIWPHSHFIGAFVGVSATISLLYLEAYATSAINFKQWMIASGVVLIGGILLCVILDDDKVFSVTLNVPIWGRTWGSYPERKIQAFAVQKGFIRAISSDSDKAGFAVDLLVHMDITNVSGSSRRVTEYRLAVGESAKGPWTYLCPINFQFLTTRLYMVQNTGDNKSFFELTPKDFLDQRLSEHSLTQGESVSGETAWACPEKASYDCRPTFTKTVIYDSLGERTEFIQNRELDSIQKDPHDWMSNGTFTSTVPKRPIPTSLAITGNCVAAFDGR